MVKYLENTEHPVFIEYAEEWTVSCSGKGDSRHEE
jgi:hypothetical protein